MPAIVKVTCTIKLFYLMHLTEFHIRSLRSFSIVPYNANPRYGLERALKSSGLLDLTGLSKENFNYLRSIVQKVTLRDARTRCVRTCIGIFLTKLKSGLSNKLLSSLFNGGKDSVRCAIASARKYLSEIHFHL